MNRVHPVRRGGRRGGLPSLDGGSRAGPVERRGGRGKGQAALSPRRSVGTATAGREGGMSLGVINIADLCNLTHFRSPSATTTIAVTRSIFLLLPPSAEPSAIVRPARGHHRGSSSSSFLRLLANHRVRNGETADGIVVRYPPRYSCHFAWPSVVLTGRPRLPVPDVDECFGPSKLEARHISSSA